MSSVIQTILKKKKVFLLLALVVVGFAFSAQGARAGWNDNWFNEILSLLLFPILESLALILSWVAEITNWAMQPSPITRSPFVLAGFKATLDFANSLFILILLGIALDFILFNSFGVKRALQKLLIIALLINFSIPIAGVVLDFANIISAHFLASVSNTNGGFTGAIAQSVGLTNIFDDGTLHKVIDPTAAKATQNSFINILFSIGLLCGMIFTFLALAAMFLIRTGYISVLLILLPIALVLSAFPPTSNHFSKWMSKFMQWVMFAPAATFFLYLSMLLLIETENNGILSMGGSGLIEPESPTYVILRYIIVWGLMLMSLTVAQSMGITGASTAKAMWSKGTKWARGKAYGAAKTGAAAAGRKVGAAENLEKLASGLQKSGIIGSGFAASKIRGVAAKTKTATEQREALTTQEKAKFEALSDEALLGEYNTYHDSIIPGKKAKANGIAVILSQRKGNALTVKRADGTVDETATTTLRQAAYDNAKAHGNKAAMDTLTEKDPRTKMHAINRKYDAKPPGTVIDGKTKDEATRDYYKNIKAKDIAELPDSFFTTREGERVVVEMLNEKSLTSSHLRAAMDEQKHAFLANVKRYIRIRGGLGTKGPPATGLYSHNPGLAGYLEGSAGKEVAGFVL